MPLSSPPDSNILNTPSKNKWRKIGLQKRAGVLVPLFSIYSRRSVGIGDFDDLKLLINWAKLSGNSILQFLALNEVGPLFCPYDSLSSFALEPMYISLSKLPSVNKIYIKNKIENIKERFPVGRTHVDYQIKKEKLQLLWEIFLKEVHSLPSELNKFIKINAYWIDDFALYRVLKDYHNGKPWYEWQEQYRNRDIRSLEAFKKEHPKEICFQMWLQWQLYKQLKDAKEYAKTKEIFIMGDLPIFVSRDSADVWTHQDFFKLEYAAGAPADMYCAKGQRWGMPTYNWQIIAKDKYRYIKERLKYAENFYDILRIDHVVGLFRVWSILYNEPLENQGLHGFFDPKDQNIWERQGREILSVMLDSTKMLLCAEDLGVIPKVCPETLKKLGILGNDVQRWVKDWKIKHNFIAPKDYRFLSVVVLSTHDTTNFAAWWENEAGTVDEQLFMRKCMDRKIDYDYVKDKLFDFSRSRHGRLRWLDSIVSSEILINILGKKKEEIADFIEIYENSYQEKEKFWRFLEMSGAMREKANSEIIYTALKKALEANSVFSIQLIIDWLTLTDIFKGDYYQYRINTPGTIDENNWSLIIPIPLEDLMQHKISSHIKEMIFSSGRK